MHGDTAVALMGMLPMCSNDGTKDVTPSNRSGVRLKHRDILIRSCAASAPRTIRASVKADVPAASSLDHFSAKEAVRLFIRALDKLDEKEREALTTIRQVSETAETLYQLVQAFFQIVRTREGERLDAWIRTMRTCHIRELNSFVASLERDKAAVLAGLTLPYSSGQTEGHITKLKLIKRMMDDSVGE
jgi:transposase